MACVGRPFTTAVVRVLVHRPPVDEVMSGVQDRSSSQRMPTSISPPSMLLPDVGVGTHSSPKRTFERCLYDSSTSLATRDVVAASNTDGDSSCPGAEDDTNVARPADETKMRIVQMRMF